MNIDGKTRTIGLIGNPVEHTLSPVIHNNISGKMNIDSVYVPFRVEGEGLAKAISGAYELNILGLNVTVPHKNAVKECLVDIDDAASDIGAVNTLVRDESKHGYKGYNTDYMGLERQIIEDGIELSGRTAVILGAGGAAKAVAYMCVKNRASKIYILNRTVDKARQIAKDMYMLKKGILGDRISSEEYITSLSMSDYSVITEDNLIVFQATSMGLSPNVDDVVIEDKEFYKKIAVGVDLIYNPATTRFMRLVKDCGGKSYNALKMLLYQGVAAYELWHGERVPQDIIEEVYLELKRHVYIKNNIVLIGFMGSGKSTAGKALADRLSMDFIDTDEYIENKAGMSISEIFEKMGEDEFRRIETETLIELRDNLSNTILATGGGMPLRRENAFLLKEIGKVLYLTAANQVIYDRVKEDTKRPLLQCDDPYTKICDLMRERRPLYEKACDMIIDTNSNDLSEVLLSIEKAVLC